MKTALYKLILALILLPAVSLANNDFDGKYTKKKKIKKEYKVSPGDLLRINNSYGNINLTTWDENRVVIEVEIKTNGDNEERVAEKLRQIDVAFDQTEGAVTAKTLLENSDKSWWNSFFNEDDNVNFEINYHVKAPVTNDVELINDYGGINIDRLRGNARISSDYGRIIIGELLGDKNILNFDYTRNSTINYIKKAEINADYSEFTIDEAGTISLEADYTDSNFGKIKNLVFNNDYGSLKIDRLKNLKGEGDYLSVEAGNLYGTLNLSMDYGSLLVDRLMASLSKFALDTDYTSVKLGYDKEAPFNFEVSTSYGEVNGLDQEGFTLNKKIQSSGDNYYEGHYLSGNTGGMIRIDSSYGNVNFTR